MADLKVSVIIELLGGKAKAGVEQFRRDFAAAQEAARGEIGKTNRSMREGVESISSQLGRLEKFAAGYVTIWKGIDVAKQLVAQADAMKNLEGRLKLATEGAASFRVAMQDVRRIADATGQGLQPISTLYGRLATSLKALGGSQRQTAEISEVVALSMKVSGASASESSAAILQLSQAFASGTLRGDEFNSVNENAPRLMKALADGIGVPVGALRQMAADGEITADVMARALPKALAKLREEAAQLPPTVEQAAQRLKNAFAEVVAAWDKQNNATGKIAAALDGLAKNMGTATTAAALLANAGLLLIGYRALAAASAVKTLAGALTLIGAGASIGADLMERFLRATTNLDEIDATHESLKRQVEVHKEFNKVIEQANQAGLPELAEKLRQVKRAALENPKADLDRTLTDVQGYANEVIAKHRALSAEKQKLWDLSAKRAAYYAGRETLTAQEAVDRQIAQVQRLAQAKKQELDKAVADLDRYRKAAESAYSRAADIQIGTADRIRELRRRDMSEAQQQADIAAQAQEKIAAAQRLLAEAQAAAARGDAGAAEKAAAGAEKFAQAAESIGAGLKDTGAAIGIVEQAGKVAADAATAVGQANERAAAGAERSVASLKAELAKLTADLDALEKKKRLIKIEAEIEQASANIARIRAELDTLQDKTITITTVHRTVEERAAGGPVGIPGFAAGGKLPGYGGGDRIPAMLEAGEFILRKEAVRHWGLDKIFALNSLRLPRFATGGLVLPAAGGSAAGALPQGAEEMTIRLQIGDRTHRVRSSREEAMALAQSLRELSRAA
jgi:tape measure domain-containing protein